MKNLILFITVYFILHAGIKAQSIAYDSLNINNVNAVIWADNVNFWDHQASSKYKVSYPGGSVSTMFVQTLQIGGLDSQNKLHSAYDAYLNNSPSSFQVGPISNIYDSAFQIQFNAVWKINRTTIDSFILYNGNSNYTIPDIIKYWPAYGDVSLGQSAYLAPFYDVNTDGIYDYQSGDYPLIKGDQAIFYMFNDETDRDTSLGEIPLKIEVFAMAYAYEADCDSNSALRNTIFIDYKIINRSQSIYHDTYLKVFSDLDIGYSYNDRVGCDVKRGAYYGYNRANSFMDNVKVAQGVVFLEGPYMDADGIDNPKVDVGGLSMCDESINGSNFGDSIIDNERLGLTGLRASYNIPNNYPPASCANMSLSECMYAEMVDSLKIYYGSQGLQYDSQLSPKIPTLFQFPGLSDSCYLGTGGIPFPGGQNWVDTVNYPTTPHDRRASGFSGPFTFKPNDIMELNIAMVTAFSDTGTVLVGVPELKQMIDTVRYYYFNNIYPCNGTFLGFNEIHKEKFEKGLTLFPNPASTNLTLEYSDDIMNARYAVYDVTGRVILKGKLDNRESTKIVLKGVNSGLYIILVEKGSKRITKRFIVN